MRYIARLKQLLKSIPKIDRVLIVIAVLLLCAPFAQIQNLLPPSSEVECARMQDARQLVDDLHSCDYAVMMAACKRAGTVHYALINSTAESVGNKDCMFAMSTRITETMDNLSRDAETREQKIAALTGWGNVTRHNEMHSVNPLVDEALYSNDLELLKRAIPLAADDVANRDATLNQLVALAKIPECQLAVLQKLRQMLQTNGYPLEYPSYELVDMLRRLEASGNLAIVFEAQAVLKLFAALEQSSGAAEVKLATERIYTQKLSSMENLLNYLATFMEALGILWGIPSILVGCMSLPSNMKAGIRTLLYGALCVSGGLATPYCINWLFPSSYGANNCF